MRLALSCLIRRLFYMLTIRLLFSVAVILIPLSLMLILTLKTLPTTVSTISSALTQKNLQFLSSIIEAIIKADCFKIGSKYLPIPNEVTYLSFRIDNKLNFKSHYR